MNPETVSSDYNDQTPNPEVVEVSNGETQVLTPTKPPTTTSNTQWRQYGEQVSTFLQDLPRYVTGFFENNKGPLTTVALIVGALIAVRLMVALLDAINGIPLVAPTLELIGLGYTGWFIYRYLLTAANRQELSAQFNALKDRVVGTDS
jgi:hypothetical protein